MGDLTERFHRVSVERAIIPWSGVVRAIEGIEEAVSLKGVKNVFVTCGVGETLHTPTSNVEKCGNVIAVADTREDALEAVNLVVKTVRIVLGSGEDLNEGLIRKNALQKLAGACSVCRVCDGRECAGWLPGIGSVGEGTGFRRNLRALRRHMILPDLLKTLNNVSTGGELFGVPLDLPVLPAPISYMQRNFRGVFTEEDYARALHKGVRKAGSTGCVAEQEHEPGEATALENIEKAFEQGAKAVGLSLDDKDGRGAAFFGEKALSRS